MESLYCLGQRFAQSYMTPDEARSLIIEGINYTAYRETDSSLYDSDKNRLFGSERYKSGRIIVSPSPWADGDFEEKMATLLRWGTVLNRSVPAFEEALTLLEHEESLIGRIIRRSKDIKGAEDKAPQGKSC